MLRSSADGKHLTDFFEIVDKIFSLTSAEELVEMRQKINATASPLAPESTEQMSGESLLWHHTDLDLHQLFNLLCYLKQYDLGIPLTEADKKEVEKHIALARTCFSESAQLDVLQCAYWLILNNNISLGVIAATCMLNYENYSADLFLSFLISLRSNLNKLKQYMSLLSEQGVQFPCDDCLNAYQVCETDNPPNTTAEKYIFRLNQILVKLQLHHRQQYRHNPESVTYINSVLTLFNLHGHEAVRAALVTESKLFQLPTGKITPDYLRTQFKPRVAGYFGKMDHPDKMLPLLTYLKKIHTHIEALYLASNVRSALSLPDKEGIDATLREWVERLHFDLRLLQLQSDKFGNTTAYHEEIRILLIHVTILRAAYNEKYPFVFGEDFLTFTTSSYRLVRTGLIVNFTPQYVLQIEQDKPRTELFQNFSTNVVEWIDVTKNIQIECNRKDMVRFIREYYLSCLLLIKTDEERGCLNANGVQSKVLALQGGDELADRVYAFTIALTDSTTKHTENSIKKHIATLGDAAHKIESILTFVSYRFIRCFVVGAGAMKRYADGDNSLKLVEKKLIKNSYDRILASYNTQLADSIKVVEALSVHFNPPLIDKQLDECFSLACVLLNVKDANMLAMYEKKLSAMSATPLRASDDAIIGSCSSLYTMLAALLTAKKRSLGVKLTDEELTICLQQITQLVAACAPTDGDVDIICVLKLYYFMATRAVKNIINPEFADSDVEIAGLLVDIHERMKAFVAAPASPSNIVSATYVKQLLESVQVIKANNVPVKQIPSHVFLSKLNEMLFGEFIKKINGNLAEITSIKTVVVLGDYFNLAVSAMLLESTGEVATFTKILSELPVAPTLQLEGDLLIEKKAIDESLSHFSNMLHVLMTAARQLLKHEFSDVVRKAYRREVHLLKDRYDQSEKNSALASLLNLVQSLVGYTALAIDSNKLGEIVTATNLFLHSLRNVLNNSRSWQFSCCDAVPQQFYDELLLSLHGILQVNDAKGLFHEFVGMLSRMLLTKLIAERSRQLQNPNAEASLSELDMLITRFNLINFPKDLKAYETYQKNNPLIELSQMKVQDLIAKKCVPHQISSLMFGENKIEQLRTSTKLMATYLESLMEVTASWLIITNASQTVSDDDGKVFIVELNKFVVDIDCLCDEAIYLQSSGHEVENELSVLRIMSLAVALFEFECFGRISDGDIRKIKLFDLKLLVFNEYFNQTLAHAILLVVNRRIQFLSVEGRSNGELYQLHISELNYLVQQYDSCSEAVKPLLAQFTMEFHLFIRRINYKIGIVGYVDKHEKTIFSRCDKQALLPFYQFMYLSTTGVSYPATESKILAEQRTFLRSLSQSNQATFCELFLKLSITSSLCFSAEVNDLIGRAQMAAKNKNNIPNEYLFIMLACINLGNVSKDLLRKFIDYAHSPRAVSIMTMELPSAVSEVTVETTQVVVERVPPPPVEAPPIVENADIEFQKTAKKCRDIIENSKSKLEARTSALLLLAEDLMRRVNEATDMALRDKMYKILESYKPFIQKHKPDFSVHYDGLLEQFKPHHRTFNAMKFETLLIEEVTVEAVLPQEPELNELTRPSVESEQQDEPVTDESEEEDETTEEEQTQEGDSVKSFDILSASYEEIIEHCAHASADNTFMNIYNLAKPIVFSSRYDKACRVRMMVVLARALLHRFDEARYHHLRHKVPNIIKTNTPFFTNDFKDELFQCKNCIAEFQKATTAAVVKVAEPLSKPAPKKPALTLVAPKPQPKLEPMLKPKQMANTASINKQLMPVPDPLAAYRVRPHNRLLESFRMPPLSPLNETFVRVLGKMNITSFLYDDSVCSPLFNVTQQHMKLVCFVPVEELFKLLTSHENSEFLYLKGLPTRRNEGLLLHLDETKLIASNEPFTRSDLFIEIKCLTGADKRLSLLHCCFEEQLNSMLFYDIKNQHMIDVAGHVNSIAVYPVTHLDPRFNVSGVLDLWRPGAIPSRDKHEVIYNVILKLSRYYLYLGCGMTLRCFIGAYKHEVNNRKEPPFLIEHFDELLLSKNAVNAARCLLNFDALYDFFPVLHREYEADFMAACVECDTLGLTQSYNDMTEQCVQRTRADFLVRALYNSFMRGKNILDYLHETGEDSFIEHVTAFIRKLPFEIFSEDNRVQLEKVLLQFWSTFLTTNLGGLYNDYIASAYHRNKHAEQDEFCKQVTEYFSTELRVTDREWLVQQLWSWHEAVNEQYQCHQTYNM